MGTDIKVTEFGRIVQSGGFWHGVWCRKNYLLFYLSEGDLIMEVNGERMKLTAGDTLVLKGGTRYAPLESNGCIYYHFCFTAGQTEAYESRFSILNSYCKNPNNFTYSYKFTPHTVVNVEQYTPHFEGSRLGKIMNRCAELDIWQRPYEKMLLDNYLKEILIHLGISRSASAVVEQRFSRMVNFIQQNYKRDIGLPEVAEKMQLSESYAAKLFRKNSGMRCCDYINRVRLSAACELLTNTSLRVSQIAEEVGYKSQYYFARQFGKVYGMTALKFRRRGTE